VNKARSVARQVWQEFAPHDDESLTFRDGNLVEVTAAGAREEFDVDPDDPVSRAASYIADRIQIILIEARQEIVPDCPVHPGAHPLQSDVVNDAAAWVCPATGDVVRYMRVTAEAT
jgi:hypothetical protein